MATKEEMAKKAVREHYNCEYPCYNYKDCVFGSGSNTSYDCGECGADEFEAGYLKGATEQRKIDIEKACEWLSQNIEQCIFEDMTLDEILQEFRKVMEE